MQFVKGIFQAINFDEFGQEQQLRHGICFGYLTRHGRRSSGIFPMTAPASLVSTIGR